MPNMEKQHNDEGMTSVRVSEDVRIWINELCKILSVNLHKKLNQNETLRWMCRQTISEASNLVRDNYNRVNVTMEKATRHLKTKEELYQNVKPMMDELSAP